MASRVWLLYAALLAACVGTSLGARPFTVNNTALRHTHPLHGRPATAPAARQGRRRPRHAAPPPSPPSPYWGNASLAGLELACAQDDAWKTCLRLGRLLHEPSGGCFELGDARPCKGKGESGGELVVDAEALREGRLRARCRAVACPSPSQRRMAWDGACHAMSEVLGRLCAGGRAVGLARHPLGGWECAEAGQGAGPGPGAQPEAAGRCALPELRPRAAATEAVRVRCSAAQAECLAQGKLPFGEGCHAPLSAAPCPAGTRLVLRERAQGAPVWCEIAQPCGPRGRRLREDGRCHSTWEVKDRLCPGDELSETPAGDMVCAAERLTFHLESRAEGGVCEVRLVTMAQPARPSVVLTGGAECAVGDDGSCQPATRGRAPPVEIVSEDA